MQNRPQLIIIKKINDYYVCKKANLKNHTFGDSVYMIKTDESDAKVLVYSRTGQLFFAKKYTDSNRNHIKKPTINTPTE